MVLPVLPVRQQGRLPGRQVELAGQRLRPLHLDVHDQLIESHHVPAALDLLGDRRRAAVLAGHRKVVLGDAVAREAHAVNSVGWDDG
jgi:hypothetical protein